jgi:hypothetical protein
MEKIGEIIKVEEVVKRKKGRPRKEVKEIDQKFPEEKKKRGRKKKEVVMEEIKQKKKRGRKAAVKYFSSSIRKKIPLTTVLQDNNNFILHLDVNDEHDSDDENDCINGIENMDINIGTVNENENDNTKDNIINSVFSELENENRDIVDKFQNEYNELLEEKNSILGDLNDDDDLQNLSDLYEERVKSRERQDNIIVSKLEEIIKESNVEENFNNDEKVNSIQENNRKKGYFEILSKFIYNKNWIYSTDVCCWWCCHNFDNIPVGLPSSYNYESNKFCVKGIFCSFSCMLAYKQDKRILNVDYLIKALYCKLTKTLLNDSELKPAPPRCSLKIFGGELNIDEFRISTKENKIYKMIDYPMYISRDFIEEIDIKNVKAVNKNIFQEKSIYNLDDKRVEDARTRLLNIERSTVTLGNTIDKFIKFS